jgi:hypothetical protein
MIGRAEGENKKIEAKTHYNKYYWAIQYEKDPDMDGNTLYPIESSKEPLPRYIKTPKEPILPKETHHTPTNIKGIEKEIGVVKKEKSKPRHILGIKHRNIPTQLDLWGNEAIFSGKGQTTLYGFPRPER